MLLYKNYCYLIEWNCWNFKHYWCLKRCVNTMCACALYAFVHNFSLVVENSLWWIARWSLIICIMLIIIDINNYTYIALIFFSINRTDKSSPLYFNNIWVICGSKYICFIHKFHCLEVNGSIRVFHSKNIFLRSLVLLIRIHWMDRWVCFFCHIWHWLIFVYSPMSTLPSSK